MVVRASITYGYNLHNLRLQAQREAQLAQHGVAVPLLPAAVQAALELNVALAALRHYRTGLLLTTYYCGSP